MSDSDTTFPFNPVEIHARKHALLCSIGFLILLPIGALVPRYTRTLRYKWVPYHPTNKFWNLTFTTSSRWFHAHWPIQFLIAGPVIFAGCALGHQTTSLLGDLHYNDPHQKIGLSLLILYVLQLSIGAFVHFFKFPSIFNGYRPPHSYFHVFFGLSIIILAQYQVCAAHK